MQNIKPNDTKIEVLLRKPLWKKGYRFRKNYKELLGKPDIVLTRYIPFSTKLDFRMKYSVLSCFFA